MCQDRGHTLSVDHVGHRLVLLRQVGPASTSPNKHELPMKRRCSVKNIKRLCPEQRLLMLATWTMSTRRTTAKMSAKNPLQVLGWERRVATTSNVQPCACRGSVTT